MKFKVGDCIFSPEKNIHMEIKRINIRDNGYIVTTSTYVSEIFYPAYMIDKYFILDKSSTLKKIIEGL